MKDHDLDRHKDIIRKSQQARNRFRPWEGRWTEGYQHNNPRAGGGEGRPPLRQKDHKVKASLSYRTPHSEPEKHLHMVALDCSCRICTFSEAEAGGLLWS